MPDPEKLHQVAALTALGRSQHQIAAATGVPRTTVDRWQDRADVVNVINELRPAIAARLSEHMWKLVDTENLDISPQQLAIIWGISMDKHDKATQPNSDGIKITINIDNRSVNVDGALGNQAT